MAYKLVFLAICVAIASGASIYDGDFTPGVPDLLPSYVKDPYVTSYSTPYPYPNVAPYNFPYSGSYSNPVPYGASSLYNGYSPLHSSSLGYVRRGW